MGWTLSAFIKLLFLKKFSIVFIYASFRLASLLTNATTQLISDSDVGCRLIQVLDHLAVVEIRAQFQKDCVSVTII